LLASAKKIWQATAKTWGSRKPSSKGARKVGSHAHVAVEQHHDVVPGGANTRIGTTAEAQIARQCDELDLRERGPDEIGAAVGRAVVDHHDFVIGIAGQGFDHRGQVLLQQVLSVPVGDDDGG